MAYINNWRQQVHRSIKLLPVRVRNVENVQTLLATLLYTPMWQITFKAITLLKLRMCLTAIHVCNGKIGFSDLKNSLYRPVAKTGSRYNDAVICLRYPSFSLTTSQKSTVTFSQ